MTVEKGYDQLGSKRYLLLGRRGYYVWQSPTSEEEGKWIWNGHAIDYGGKKAVEVISDPTVNTELGHLALYAAYIHQTTGRKTKMGFQKYAPIKVRPYSTEQPYENVSYMSPGEIDSRLEIVKFKPILTGQEQIDMVQTALLTVTRFNIETDYHKKMLEAGQEPDDKEADIEI